MPCSMQPDWMEMKMPLFGSWMVFGAVALIHLLGHVNGHYGNSSLYNAFEVLRYSHVNATFREWIHVQPVWIYLEAIDNDLCSCEFAKTILISTATTSSTNSTNGRDNVMFKYIAPTTGSYTLRQEKLEARCLDMLLSTGAVVEIVDEHVKDRLLHNALRLRLPRLRRWLFTTSDKSFLQEEHLDLAIQLADFDALAEIIPIIADTPKMKKRADFLTRSLLQTCETPARILNLLEKHGLVSSSNLVDAAANGRTASLQLLLEKEFRAWMTPAQMDEVIFELLIRATRNGKWRTSAFLLHYYSIRVSLLEQTRLMDSALASENVKTIRTIYDHLKRQHDLERHEPARTQLNELLFKRLLDAIREGRMERSLLLLDVFVQLSELSRESKQKLAETILFECQSYETFYEVFLRLKSEYDFNQDIKRALVINSDTTIVVTLLEKLRGAINTIRPEEVIFAIKNHVAGAGIEMHWILENMTSDWNMQEFNQIMNALKEHSNENEREEWIQILETLKESRPPNTNKERSLFDFVYFWRRE